MEVFKADHVPSLGSAVDIDGYERAHHLRELGEFYVSVVHFEAPGFMGGEPRSPARLAAYYERVSSTTAQLYVLLPFSGEIVEFHIGWGGGPTGTKREICTHVVE